MEWDDVGCDGVGKVPGMELRLGVCVAEVAIPKREWWMTAEVSSPGLDGDHDTLRTITVSGADLFFWSQSLPFPYTPKPPSNMADQSGEIDLDSVIDRLLEGELRVSKDESTSLTRRPVRGNRPGKAVQLLEYEIKYLCTKAREIFISQPILLELEAPIKICGRLTRMPSSRDMA